MDRRMQPSVCSLAPVSVNRPRTIYGCRPCNLSRVWPAAFVQQWIRLCRCETTTR